MFCANCGKKVEDGAKFCPGCGTKVGEVNSSKKDVSNIDISSAAQVLIKKGTEYAKERDFDNAIAAFGKAIKIVPDYPETYILRGKALSQIYELKSATKDLNKAIELDPNNPKAFFERGLIYFNRKDDEDPAYDGIDDEEEDVDSFIEQAVMDLSVAIELQDDYVEAYKERALIYSFQDNYDDAIEDYTKLLELEPGEAEHYRERGYVYYLQGEMKTAIQDFTKALEIDPKDFDACSKRGCALHANKDYENALSDFNKALSLSPGNSPILSDRGLTYFEQKKYDLALADYNEAIEGWKIDATLYLRRAEVYFLTDRYLEGQADYEEAWRLNPNIPRGKMPYYAELLAIKYADTIEKIAEDEEKKEPSELYIIIADEVMIDDWKEAQIHYVMNQNTPTYETAFLSLFVDDSRYYTPQLRFLTYFDAERYCYELKNKNRFKGLYKNWRVKRVTERYDNLDSGRSFLCIMRGTTGEIIRDVAEDGKISWDIAENIWGYENSINKSTQEDPFQLFLDVLRANEDMTDLYMILHTV